MSGVFQTVSTARPGRSVFNLSYRKRFTCDMGQLIPVMCDEVVPGDKFNIGNQSVIRFQPLVAPAMHEINCYVHYYFVPYRLLWDDWEDYISKGVTGDYTASLPKWSPTNNAKGSLWDFLGLPVGVVPTGRLPMDFPRRAYNRIYNEFYRDETLISEVSEDQENILNRSWEKDYFTSSLPWQQRGTAPAMPIAGSATAVFPADIALAMNAIPGGEQVVKSSGLPASGNVQILWQNDTTWVAAQSTKGDTGSATRGLASSRPPLTPTGVVPHANLSNNTIDLSTASSFDVNEFRTIFQIQRWMERNARGGARYTEFLRVHFNTSPRDDRLQRPEYLGGSKSPIVISEVLQTSSSDPITPQGNLAGHGIGVNQAFCANYYAQEYGLIMGIMSVMPRPAYSQGIDRQWLRDSPYDFYFPEFANLSEQAIERVELYATNVEAENKTLFGYQGRYDEMRVKKDLICSEMRDTFDYWHLSRKFSSPPILNGSFITCTPASTKRIFAVQDAPGLIVNFGNLIKAVRPLPIQSQPGLIDHN